MEATGVVLGGRGSPSAIIGLCPYRSSRSLLTGALPCFTSSSLSFSYNTKLATPPATGATHLALSHCSSPSKLYSHVSITRKPFKPVFLARAVASSEGVEQSYIMIKPDGVQRGLVGEIISRFEKKGFKLTGLKLFQCPKELAEEHYKDLQSKPFFPKLINYITSGPVVCMAWEGVGVVASARKLIGSTNPLQAEPGTIRGDLAVQTGRNVVHGSDSEENGKREIALWFKEGELCQWTPAQEHWLRE